MGDSGANGLSYYTLEQLADPFIKDLALSDVTVTNLATLLALVVQTLDSAIHRINHYPMDRDYGNQLRYSLDSDLSGG